MIIADCKIGIIVKSDNGIKYIIVNVKEKLIDVRNEDDGENTHIYEDCRPDIFVKVSDPKQITNWRKEFQK